jgi:hypothetical protein
VSAPLSADPAALRATQPGLAVLRDAIHAASARLIEVLDGEGACWGADETGRAFGGRYRPAERELRAAFVRVGGRLHEVSDAVAIVAEALAEADLRAGERMA